jgi:two-component system, response regulator PdtaR
MPKSVLLVDEGCSGYDLAGTLLQAGWRVLGPARTVRDALNMLRRETPAAVIMDCKLDGTDADRLTERLHALEVPLAIFSTPEQGPTINSLAHLLGLLSVLVEMPGRRVTLH